MKWIIVDEVGNMNTKLLLGSIGMVTILILVSFSNVASIQSIELNTVNNSPLFTIRTNKATDTENNNILTSNYIGKGSNAIQFPIRDNRNILVQNVIQIIQKMDDKEFNRFQTLILSHLYKEPYSTNSDRNTLLPLLKIRNNPNNADITQFDISGNFTHPPTIYTCYTNCPLNCFTTGEWTPGCIFSFIFMVIIGLLSIGYNAILHGLLKLLTIDNCFYSHT